MNNLKRLIPTDKEWYDYNHNKYCAWLFSYMVSCATYNPTEKDLYITKKSFNKTDNIKLILKFLNVKNKKTVIKYLDKLIDLGYVKTTDTDTCYHLLNYTENTYVLIDKDLLYNICITKSALSIQIFIYLLERMTYKQQRTKENIYNFTLKELEIVLGFSGNSQNYNIESAIKECLQTLKAESYINYKIVHIELNDCDKNYKIPNYQLTYITERLPQSIQEIKQSETAETAQESVNETKKELKELSKADIRRMIGF